MKPCFICGSPELCPHREEGLIPLYVASAHILRAPEPEPKGKDVNGTSKKRVN